MQPITSSNPCAELAAFQNFKALAFCLFYKLFTHVFRENSFWKHKANRCNSSFHFLFVYCKIIPLHDIFFAHVFFQFYNQTFNTFWHILKTFIFLIDINSFIAYLIITLEPKYTNILIIFHILRLIFSCLAGSVNTNV